MYVFREEGKVADWIVPVEVVIVVVFWTFRGVWRRIRPDCVLTWKLFKEKESLKWRVTSAVVQGFLKWLILWAMVLDFMVAWRADRG